MVSTVCLKEHSALHTQFPHKSILWLEIQDERRWISSEIHMDGKVNVDSGISAAWRRYRHMPLWRRDNAALVCSVCSPTLVIKVFCPCTDTNFAKRFLTACHAFLWLPLLFQITKCRFGWVFGRSVFHGAPNKIDKQLCTSKMLQIIYT